MAPTKPISIDFSVPTNQSELAVLIGVDEKIFELAVNPDLANSAYTKHYIPKRSKHRLGGYRVAWEAPSSLAAIYKAFARRFDLYLRAVEPRYPHPSAYGYVKGRGTIDNAKKHCGAAKILHADIVNFFPSISKLRIKQLFERYGVNAHVAGLLRDFVTIEGALPLGLHPSPMLANIVCIDLDDKLSKLAQEHGCAYTRYADDVTMSGMNEVPDREAIQTIFEEEGFQFSDRKFRITKPGQAHYVTGLSVTDKRLPHVPRSMKRRIRQELFYCEKYGVISHLNRAGVDETEQKGINRIDGSVKYISHIEKEAMPHLRKQWNALLESDGLEVSYEPIRNHGPVRIVDFFVDETELEHGGKKYLALCLVQTENTKQIDVTTQATLRQHMVDPFSGVRVNTLKKKRLHYTDSTEDLRKAYVDKLSVLPYKSYLVFGEISHADEYADTYVKLLTKTLLDRLIGCDQAAVRIVFEENSKIRASRLSSVVQGLFSDLIDANNRRPLSLQKIIGKKTDHPCFSVPDFMLSIFSGYARSNVNPDNRRTLFFEKLRDKYSIILNADNGDLHSRKRPFKPWGRML